jgi:L,D-transpeptidase ErfK/SrfK
MATTTTLAAVYALPPKGDAVIGSNQVAEVKKDDSLSMVAERNDAGYYELLEANPDLDPLHLKEGTQVLIPHQIILPNAPREGIVINLAELRLYYYPPGVNKVITYPVGIGRIGDQWQTPTGELTIVEKQKDPEWHVPQSVLDDMIKRGKVMPEVIPAGPNNPLGAYMMRMSNEDYLIHGTDHAYVVGRRTTAGCISLYPEDIAPLFSMIPLNTKVTIVNQPFKAGWLNGQLYFEAHRPLREERFRYRGHYDNLWNEALKSATAKRAASVNWNAVQILVKNETGVAEVVGTVATQSAAS